MLARLVEAVDDGRLEADGPVAAGLVKRMHGAVEALRLDCPPSDATPQDA